jgi:hypothetical protein
MTIVPALKTVGASAYRRLIVGMEKSKGTRIIFVDFAANLFPQRPCRFQVR